MTIENEFDKNVVIKKTKHGYSVKCKKGFWGVYAPDKQHALREARHYFLQYYADGEYSGDLDPESLRKILKRAMLNAKAIN